MHEEDPGKSEVSRFPAWMPLAKLAIQTGTETRGCRQVPLLVYLPFGKPAIPRTNKKKTTRTDVVDGLECQEDSCFRALYPGPPFIEMILRNSLAIL